jgi:hypothetical protein
VTAAAGVLFCLELPYRAKIRHRAPVLWLVTSRYRCRKLSLLPAVARAAFPLSEPAHYVYLCLGWPVIGIWSGTMDGTDVNAVHRSRSGRLLATSDDFGKVNVFRYGTL